MGIQASDSLVHWNYYIALEQDLAKLARFIEFSADNFNTYSIELAHLLLAALSEVDVVIKALCKIKDRAKNHGNINHYKETILASFPELPDERCYINRYGLTLEPWSDWNGEGNPLWWRSYTDVKHHRDTHFSAANLKNTLNSVAALSLVLIYYYREIFSASKRLQFRDVIRKLLPQSSLIELDDSYTYDLLEV